MNRYELTINGVVYQFHFGMGFMREINKLTKQKNNGIEENVGLQYACAGLLDGNPESLVNILLTGNKGCTPRVTQEILDDYIDNPNTDIDKLFDEVLDFLAKANATKRTVTNLQKAVEEAQKQ